MLGGELRRPPCGWSGRSTFRGTRARALRTAIVVASVLAAFAAPTLAAATVTFDTGPSAAPTQVNESTSSTVSWTASSNAAGPPVDGPYSVRVGGTDCATGTVVDSGTYTFAAPGASAIASTSFAEGGNTVRVCITDDDGTFGAATSVTKDGITPDTSITGGPANGGATSDSTPTFTFAVVESPSTTAVSFDCRFDSAAFAPCTSPFTPTTALTEAPHTFEVRARDAIGHIDATPAQRIFTVDLTTPTPAPVIVAGPPALSNSTSASFTIDQGVPSEPVTLLCKLDALATAPCSSVPTFTGLAPGAHTLIAISADAAGNQAQSLPYNWTIDTTPPAGPTGLASTPATTSGSPSADVAPEIRGTIEAGAVLAIALTADCSNPLLTGVSALEFAAGVTTTLPAPPPTVATTFAFRFVVTDAAGNPSPCSGPFNYFFDPTTPDTLIDAGPGSFTNTNSIQFTFHSTPDGATFQCKLDSAAFAPCSSPANLTTTGGDVQHTFQVRAHWPNGQVDATPASATWTVDTVTPDTRLLTQPPPTTTAKNASFTFDSPDDETAFFDCQIDGGAFTACSTGSFSRSGLAEGPHTVVIRARDAAGNQDASPVSYTWTVLGTINTTISKGPPDVTDQTTATFEFTASKPGATFECSLDEGPFAPCPNPHTVASLTGGVHFLAVRAVDTTGAKDGSPATWEWEVKTSVAGGTLPEVTNARARFRAGVVTLTWQTPNDAVIDHVEITRSPKPLGEPDNTIFSSVGDTALDPAVSKGERYAYMIFTVDSAGKRSEGVKVVITTGKRAVWITVPKGKRRLAVQSVVRGKLFFVNWIKVKKALAYEIEIKRGKFSVLFEVKNLQVPISDRLPIGVLELTVRPVFKGDRYGDLIDTVRFQVKKK